MENMYNIEKELHILEKSATAIKYILIFIGSVLTFMAIIGLLISNYPDFTIVMILIWGLFLIGIGFLSCSILRIYVSNSRNLILIEERLKNGKK